MTAARFRTPLLVNTVLLALGLVPSVGLQLMFVMRGASALQPGLPATLGSALAIGGHALPLFVAMGAVLPWLAYLAGARRLATTLAIAPWVWLLALLALSLALVVVG